MTTRPNFCTQDQGVLGRIHRGGYWKRLEISPASLSFVVGRNTSNLLPVILAALPLCSGCSGGSNQVVQPTPKQRLQASWSATDASAQDRCAAINACFTNGTPMRDVLAVLGNQDTMIITTTLSWPPETQNQRIWVYRFGNNEVHVHSTGGPTTPLGERGFAGATFLAANKMGQPGSSPNGVLREHQR